MRYRGVFLYRYLPCLLAALHFAQQPAVADGPTTSQLSLWLKGDSGLAPDGSTWADQSGNGHNATALPGKAPSTSVSVVSGLRVPGFSGSQAMAIAGQVITSQQFTIMAAVTDNSGGSGRHDILSNWDSTSTEAAFLGVAGGPSQKGRFSDYLGGLKDSRNAGAGTVVDPSRTFVLTGISTASGAQIYQGLNQIAQRGSSFPAMLLKPAYYIGRQGTLNGEYWRGDIAELLVYNKALSADELSANVRYLTGKWMPSPPATARQPAAAQQPATAGPAPDLRRGLVLYFNFDSQEPGGAVTDQSGNGNNGKVTGATWTANGRKGGAYQFAPTQNYISVPNSQSLNVKQVTLAAWIKTAWADSVWRRIFDKEDHLGFALSIGGLVNQDKQWQGRASFETNARFNASDAVVADGEWHHLVGMFDGAQLKLYVDGKLQKRIARWTNDLAANPFDLTIGANRSNPDPKLGEVGASFVGTIDEAMIYNRALSEEEVKLLYESVAGPAAGSSGATSELATVTIKSVPDGAEVTVDGKFRGNTPATLRLLAGDHAFQVTSPGFRRWERTATVTPGGTSALNANLEPAEAKSAEAVASPSGGPGTMGPDSVYRVGNGVSQPTLLTKAEPIYSAVAKKLRVQDTATLQVVISPDGTTRSFKSVRSPGYGLDERAIEGVRQWRFSPGIKDGKAVAVMATVQVNFRLLDINNRTTWYSGPMVFAAAEGLTPPAVEDGTMPKPGESSDESVVLEFTVSSSGSVNNIHTIHGSTSASELLARNLATWKFRPAMKGNESVQATGRVRFLKGVGDADAKLPLSPPLL